MWGSAGSCCLQVWRDLSLANTELAATTANMKIISSVLLDLKNSPASPLWSTTLLSLLSVLQDLPAPESVLVTVDQVLDLITGADTETSREVVESLTRLFSTYCYPTDQLSSLTARLETFRDSENFSNYLDMLKQVMDNMAKSEARWAANVEVKEADKNSALQSSEGEIFSLTTFQLPDINTWGLDVFSASKVIKDGRVLTSTTFKIFQERNLCETFHIEQKVLLTFLMTLEDHYLKVISSPY